jgi:hypothetical protein
VEHAGGMEGKNQIDVAASTIYTQYRDLAGNTTIIQSETVPIGSLPILLENQ